MSQIVDGTGYNCRPRVLVAFFKQSRDRWKERCLETKRVLKRITNRGAWLLVSRDAWKERARELEREVQRLERELQQRRGEQNVGRR